MTDPPKFETCDVLLTGDTYQGELQFAEQRKNSLGAGKIGSGAVSAVGSALA